QPLIAPLYDGKTAHELLSALVDQPSRSPYDLVRDYWRQRHARGGDAVAAGGHTGGMPPHANDGEFESFWRRAVHDGIVPASAAAPRSASLRGDWLTVASRTWAALDRAPATGLEIVFRPDPTVYDGRFANNGWL